MNIWSEGHDFKVTEEYHIAVAEESDMPGFVFESGMIIAIFGAFFNRFGDIGIQNGRPVEDDFDFVAARNHFLAIPFTDRLLEATFGRYCAVDGTVILVFFKVGIFFGGIVENLQLHTGIGGITGQGGTDAQAIIGAGGQLEFKFQVEIAELIGGV